MNHEPVQLPPHGPLIDMTRPGPRSTPEEVAAALQRMALPSKPWEHAEKGIRGQNTPPKKLKKFEFKSSLKWQMSLIQGGQQTFIDVIRASVGSDSMHEQAEDLVNAWDAKVKARQKPSLDDLCAELKIPAAVAYGWFAQAGYEQSLNFGRGILSAAMPAILQASIERALNVDEGHDERKLLMNVQGMLPKPGGVNVAVQQNNAPLPAGTQDPGDPMGEFEAEQRRTTNALRAAPQKALASPGEAIDVQVTEAVRVER